MTNVPIEMVDSSEEALELAFYLLNLAIITYGVNGEVLVIPNGSAVLETSGQKSMGWVSDWDAETDTFYILRIPVPTGELTREDVTNLRKELLKGENVN